MSSEEEPDESPLKDRLLRSRRLEKRRKSRKAPSPTDPEETEGLPAVEEEGKLFDDFEEAPPRKRRKNSAGKGGGELAASKGYEDILRDLMVEEGADDHDDARNVLEDDGELEEESEELWAKLQASTSATEGQPTPDLAVAQALKEYETRVRENVQTFALERSRLEGEFRERRLSVEKMVTLRMLFHSTATLPLWSAVRRGSGQTLGPTIHAPLALRVGSDCDPSQLIQRVWFNKSSAIGSDKSDQVVSEKEAAKRAALVLSEWRRRHEGAKKWLSSIGLSAPGGAVDVPLVVERLTNLFPNFVSKVRESTLVSPDDHEETHSLLLLKYKLNPADFALSPPPPNRPVKTPFADALKETDDQEQGRQVSEAGLRRGDPEEPEEAASPEELEEAASPEEPEEAASPEEPEEAESPEEPEEGASPEEPEEGASPEGQRRDDLLGPAPLSRTVSPPRTGSGSSSSGKPARPKVRARRPAPCPFIADQAEDEEDEGEGLVGEKDSRSAEEDEDGEDRVLQDFIEEDDSTVQLDGHWKLYRAQKEIQTEQIYQKLFKRGSVVPGHVSATTDDARQLERINAKTNLPEDEDCSGSGEPVDSSEAGEEEVESDDDDEASDNASDNTSGDFSENSSPACARPRSNIGARRAPEAAFSQGGEKRYAMQRVKEGH